MTTQKLYYVEAFDQQFPLTEEQVKKSKYLESALGLTGFKKSNNVAKLDFDNDVRLAFDYIYNTLINGMYQPIQKDDVYGILILEHFLIVPLVLTYVKEFLDRSNYDINYYTELYTSNFPYSKDITDILENKILNKTTNADEIPDKLLDKLLNKVGVKKDITDILENKTTNAYEIPDKLLDKLLNKVGVKNVLNIFIKKNNTLKYKLQTVNTALEMKSPTYWEDYSDYTSDTRWNYNETIRENMDKFIDIDKFLEEAESSHNFYEVVALAKLNSSTHTSVLESEKFAKLFKFLVKHKLVDSLKNIDEDIIEQAEEYISEETYDEYTKLINEHP